jgi:hypothetical protein
VDRSKAQVGEYVDRGKEYVDRGKAQVNDLVSQGKHFVNEQGDRVQAAVEAGRQAYRSTTGPEGVASEEPTHL